MRKKYRLLIFILCILILCAGCQSKELPREDTAEQTETSEPPSEARADELVLAIDGSPALQIVLPEDANEQIRSAANKLSEQLSSLAKCAFSIQNDHTPDGSIVDSAGEIVLGNCRRADAQARLQELRFEDYTVCFTERNLVVAAYASAAVERAVEALIAALESAEIEQTEGRVVLKWKSDLHGEGASPRRMPTLFGVPLSFYRIVYPKGEENRYAVVLQTQFAQRYETLLPIVDDTAEETAYEILMGQTNRALSQSVYQSALSPKRMQYNFVAEDGKLLIAGGGAFSLSQAVEKLCALLARDADTRLDVLLNDTPVSLMKAQPTPCQADYRFMTFNLLVEYDGWGSGGNIPPEVEIRKEITSELILRYKPDVAALEEVFETWQAQLPPMIQEEYGFVEVTRTDGSTNRTLLIYNRSRVKVVDSGYVDIEAKATVNKRVVVWGLFEDLKTQKRFLVFGTHLSVTNEADRIKEAERIADTVASLKAKYPVPLLIMGDMNSTADAVETLRQACDVSVGVSRRVDYVLCDNQKARVLYKAVVEGNYADVASDHRPIFCDVSFS